MSRRRSKSNSRNDLVQRGPITTTAIPRMLHTINLLQQLEQNNAYHRTRRSTQNTNARRYHPNPIRPIQKIDGNLAGFNHHRLSTLYQSPWKLVEPNKVGICVRRRTRREVLHALKRTGKGSRARRHYTVNSEIHCR